MWLYHKWLLSRINPIRFSAFKVIKNDNDTLTIGAVLNRKVKGISAKNLEISVEGKPIEATINAPTETPYSLVLKIVLKKSDVSSDKPIKLRFKNLYQIIEENKELTFSGLEEYRARDIDSNSLLDFNEVDLRLENDTIIFEAVKSDNYQDI